MRILGGPLSSRAGNARDISGESLIKGGQPRNVLQGLGGVMDVGGLIDAHAQHPAGFDNCGGGSSSSRTTAGLRLPAVLDSARSHREDSGTLHPDAHDSDTGRRTALPPIASASPRRHPVESPREPSGKGPSHKVCSGGSTDGSDHHRRNSRSQAFPQAVELPRKDSSLSSESTRHSDDCALPTSARSADSTSFTQSSHLTGKEELFARGGVALSSPRLCDKRRSACEALRRFVFGVVGTEELSDANETLGAFHDGLATPLQIKQLHQLWLRIKPDGSERVYLPEFKAFCNSRKLIKIQREHSEKIQALLLGRHSSFSIEDMMRIMWPLSSFAQLRQMYDMVEECRQLDLLQSFEPPMLPSEDYEELMQTWRSLNADGEATIRFDMLVSSGLIDAETARGFEADWDFVGSGHLTIETFLMIMAPTGYRAFGSAHWATDTKGTLIHLESDGVWRPSSSPPNKRPRCRGLGRQ